MAKHIRCQPCAAQAGKFSTLWMQSGRHGVRYRGLPLNFNVLMPAGLVILSNDVTALPVLIHAQESRSTKSLCLQTAA